MSKHIIDIFSIVPLSLGSIIMLASGSGFISSRYAIVAGLLCFIFSALIEGVFKKKYGVKNDQR
jgi:hypothetical protein